MGTPLKPIRLFLSPRLNSSALKLNNLEITNRCIAKENDVVKKLEFTSPKFIKNKNKEGPININIIDTDKLTPKKSIRNSSLLVNTPNKLNIFKNGINSFNNLDILGRGNFGIVVRGNYKGEDVAVKVTKTKSAIKELNSLNLNHTNIIKMKEIFTHEIHSIVIMEYLIDSKQLQTILNDENIEISNDVVLKYSKNICEGVKFCHQNEILHLDLKPSNILVTKDGICKICDFGNSMKVNCKDEEFKHEGTIIYTAPEILLGKRPTFSSDVYSLGIIFWQIRYRKIPLGGLRNNEVIIYKVVKFGLRPFLIGIEEIQDQFCELYKSCWHNDPNLRPTIQSVINTLNHDF